MCVSGSDRPRIWHSARILARRAVAPAPPTVLLGSRRYQGCIHLRLTKPSATSHTLKLVPSGACRLFAPRWSRGHQVGEREALVAQHRFTDIAPYPRSEARPVGDERVELAALTARIDRCGQLGEERGIVATTGEIRGQLLGVDAHDPRIEAVLDDLAGERVRVLAPEREDRLEAERSRSR